MSFFEAFFYYWLGAVLSVFGSGYIGYRTGGGSAVGVIVFSLFWPLFWPIAIAWLLFGIPRSDCKAADAIEARADTPLRRQYLRGKNDTMPAAAQIKRKAA